MTPKKVLELMSTRYRYLMTACSFIDSKPCVGMYIDNPILFGIRLMDLALDEDIDLEYIGYVKEPKYDAKLELYYWPNIKWKK